MVTYAVVTHTTRVFATADSTFVTKLPSAQWNMLKRGIFMRLQLAHISELQKRMLRHLDSGRWAGLGWGDLGPDQAWGGLTHNQGWGGLKGPHQVLNCSRQESKT